MSNAASGYAHRFLVLCALALPWLGGCASVPALDARRSLFADRELGRQRPSDIAILPIQDSTPGRSLAGLDEEMWTVLGRSLAERQYVPLSRAHVMSQLRSQGIDLSGNLTDPSVLRNTTGRFDEDATLAVRVLRWDESQLRTRSRVNFRLDVLLLSALGGKALWSGSMEGSVKAGGEGPAPRDYETARSSCAVEMIQGLIRELPVRQPR